MKKSDWLKAFKIAAGCSLAFLFAGHGKLSFPSSVVTITLLSILNTRRDTLGAAVKRFFAFLLTAVTAAFFFQAFHYSVLSLFLYLFFSFLLCIRFQVLEGFSMSTVLLLHLWNAKTFAGNALFNEFCLMSIGILTGILANLYMPSRIRQIHRARAQIEALMRSIFSSLAKALLGYAPLSEASSLLILLESELKDALLHAEYTKGNGIFHDMQYYTRYLSMRNTQCLLLKQLHKNLSRIPAKSAPLQCRQVAGFFLEISLSLHEHNNTAELFTSLKALRQLFSRSALPVTREEFRARAVLYELINETEELLLLKKQFVESLTEREVRRFW